MHGDALIGTSHVKELLVSATGSDAAVTALQHCPGFTRVARFGKQACKVILGDAQHLGV